MMILHCYILPELNIDITHIPSRTKHIYITLAQEYLCATPSVPAGEWGWGMVGLEIMKVRVISAIWDPVFEAIRLSVGFVWRVL